VLNFVSSSHGVDLIDGVIEGYETIIFGFSSLFEVIRTNSSNICSDEDNIVFFECFGGGGFLFSKREVKHLFIGKSFDQ